MSTLRVAILAYDEVEALDFAGPYEVFTTAARVAARDAPGEPPVFEVYSVARDATPVRARAGLRLLPDHSLVDAPRPDLLVVPGGVVDAVRTHRATLDWIAAVHRGTRLTASVCTGAFLLADAGVLTEGAATTHWEDIAELRAAHPALALREGVRWVENGRVFSSAGISAGIDLSLHLVARLAGEPLARRTARQMDYRWQED